MHARTHIYTPSQVCSKYRYFVIRLDREERRFGDGGYVLGKLSSRCQRKLGCIQLMSRNHVMRSSLIPWYGILIRPAIQDDLHTKRRRPGGNTVSNTKDYDANPYLGNFSFCIIYSASHRRPYVLVLSLSLGQTLGKFVRKSRDWFI